MTEQIIGAAIEVHKILGPGLLESVYEAALFNELNSVEGLIARRQVPIQVIYKKQKLSVGYRIDLLVNEKVILELKVVEEISKLHLAQTLTYLKLSGKQLALIINFNVKLLKHGIKRVLNDKSSVFSVSCVV
ncbi:GxxExxY protein [bacterium]|nr:GxxExxY protein [bacterium]